MPEIRSDVGRAANQPATKPAGVDPRAVYSMLMQNLVCQSNGRSCQMGARLFSGKMNELIPDKPPLTYPRQCGEPCKNRLRKRTRKIKFRVSFVRLSFRKHANNLNSYLRQTFPLMPHAGNFRRFKEMTKITQSTQTAKMSTTCICIDRSWRRTEGRRVSATYTYLEFGLPFLRMKFYDKIYPT